MNPNKSLKIAVVVGVFPTISETFITNQLLYLKNEGHQVDILATRYIDTNNRFKTPDFVNLLKTSYTFNKRGLIPVSKFKRLLKALHIFSKTKNKKLLLKACNVFKYGKKAINLEQFFNIYYYYYFNIEAYDVVHIHFGDNAIHLQKLIKNYNKKVVLTFHGYDAHKIKRAFYKPLVSYKNLVITVNTMFTREKVMKLGFIENNIHILPVSLDTSFFKPKPKENKSFNVLFIGRLIEFKAPLLAIKIVEKLIKNQNDVYLNIVGDGPLYKECQDYIFANNLSQNINLLGSQTQEEIIALMEETSVFLFPGIIDINGRCENQGLVIQEAQSMKIPPIISNVGGMPEGILHERTGFVVTENDIDSFVTKLLFLKNHPQVRQTMGEEARKFIVSNYDSRILGNKLVEIYQQ